MINFLRRAWRTVRARECRCEFCAPQAAHVARFERGQARVYLPTLDEARARRGA